MSGWSAWQPDFYTIYWFCWMVPGFFIPELIAVFGKNYEGTLTAHLRPLFTSGGAGGLTYWICVGLLLWFGYHIFVDGVFVNQGLL